MKINHNLNFMLFYFIELKLTSMLVHYFTTELRFIIIIYYIYITISQSKVYFVNYYNKYFDNI